MKKILLIGFIIAFSANTFGQNCDLSAEAKRYWLRATTAMESIINDDDYQLAANEFEKALQYAPRCSDIYYNLAVVYSHIEAKRGEWAFNKAEGYLKDYLKLEPNDEEAKDLLVKIEFRKEKYQRDLAIGQQKKTEEKWAALKQLEGSWRYGDKGYFNFEIIVNSQNALIIPKPYFENGQLEYSYGKSNLTINEDNTYSFFIEAIYHHNEGNMGGGNGPHSNNFTTYSNLVGTLELTSDGMLKCSYYDKSIKDVDNKNKRTYYVPKDYDWNNYLYTNFYQKSY